MKKEISLLHPSFVRSIFCMGFFLCLLLSNYKANAQKIFAASPMENLTGKINCAGSCDAAPKWGSTLAPYVGTGFMGFHEFLTYGGETWSVPINQVLATGKTYTYSVMAAIVPITASLWGSSGMGDNDGIIYVYASSGACLTNQLIGTIQLFTPTHKNKWTRFCFVFTATANWTHLTFQAKTEPQDYTNCAYMGIDDVLDNMTVTPSNASCSAPGSATALASGGTAPYTYSWSNGQTGATATGLSPGTYTVSSVDGNGCFQVTQTVTITQTTGFTVNTSSTPTSCGSNNGTATAAPAGTGPFTYSWSPSGGSAATATGLTAGTYTVFVTSGSGCTATQTVTVASSTLVTASTSSTPTNCGNSGTASVTVTGGSGTYTYLWLPTGGNGSTATNLSAGTYTVIVTDANGCSTTKTVTVGSTGAVNPVVTNGSACKGQTIILTASGGTNYSWSTGATTTAITVSPSTTTTYSVVVSSGTCSVTVTATATVRPSPTAVFSSTAPCLGSSVQFTNQSISPAGDPIVSWNWNMIGGMPASANSQNTSTLYTTAGSHLVTLIVATQAGCTDTLIQQVLVYNPPAANFSGPASGCAPVCTGFSDLSSSTDGTITNWQWSFPGGSPSVSGNQNPSNICYNTPGNYSVSMVVTTSYGCKTTLSLPLIQVHPWPTADFCVAPSLVPATNPIVNYCDLWSSDVVSWVWDFGDNTFDSTNTDPVHSYSTSITGNDFYTFNACLKVQNQYGCWDTACKMVELKPEFTFYIPNAFTPNSDWSNELFYGKGKGIKEYSISIFDRWGNQVWNCHQEDASANRDNTRQEGLPSACKWDGKIQKGGMDMSGGSGQPAQEDVYVWKVKLTDIFDREHNYVGHVSVVK